MIFLQSSYVQFCLSLQSEVALQILLFAGITGLLCEVATRLSSNIYERVFRAQVVTTIQLTG